MDCIEKDSATDLEKVELEENVASNQDDKKGWWLLRPWWKGAQFVKGFQII